MDEEEEVVCFVENKNKRIWGENSEKKGRKRKKKEKETEAGIEPTARLSKFSSPTSRPRAPK
jgi:hypothetical protein